MSESEFKIEMVIDRFGTNPIHREKTVILKEKYGQRYVSIEILSSERIVIVERLVGGSSRRLTHDFLFAIINYLGGTVKNVIINNVRNDVFYTVATIKGINSESEIDCEPSDALALALTADVPIFILESVLAKASMTTDTNIAKAT